MQISSRNQRREAYSYFVTSGAPLVSGLVWKGQDARRGQEITGLGLGPPWWPSSPFWGMEAFALCRLSLGYTEGNKISGDLNTT